MEQLNLHSQGILSKNIAGITGALESVILNEELARRRGLLQLLDPRVKLATTFLFIIVVGLVHSLWLLTFILVLVLILSLASAVPTRFFLKRLVLFIPIFALVIAIPALFIVEGDPLIYFAGKTLITAQGARTAGFLLLRVTDSLGFGLLLILSTPWNILMRALRWFRLPALVVDVLGMTYRYIFLFLHTANSMFLVRRSRVIGTLSASENRRWLVRSLAVTMAKSQYLSEEIYQAMLSRGYQGEIRIINDFAFKSRDLLWLILTVLASLILLWINIL